MMGVADGRVWFQVDAEPGVWFFPMEVMEQCNNTATLTKHILNMVRLILIVISKRETNPSTLIKKHILKGVSRKKNKNSLVSTFVNFLATGNQRG